MMNHFYVTAIGKDDMSCTGYDMANWNGKKALVGQRKL